MKCLKISVDQVLFVLSNVLLFICIFDPSGLLFGIKNVVFFLIISIYFCKKIFTKDRSVNIKLVEYIIAFSLFLPIASLLVYYLFQYSKGIAIDLNMLKTFLFLLFSLIVYDLNDRIAKSLMIILTMLSVMIICIFLLISFRPYYTDIINAFGQKYLIGKIVVQFIGNYKNVRIYFWTSPLIVFSCIYFYSKYLFSRSNRKVFFLITIVNIIGLFLSGSRLNIIVSILVIPIVYFFYSSSFKKSIIILLCFAFISFVFLYYFDFLINSFFSLKEQSNTVKLGLAADYFKIYFSDIYTFLFGQGVGTYFYQTRGLNLTYSELTYFEIFRRFGFVFGYIYLVLMFYPIRFIKKNLDSNIIIAYFVYLIMSFFNPFFFSSSGILVLSIVVSYVFKNNLFYGSYSPSQL